MRTRSPVLALVPIFLLPFVGRGANGSSDTIERTFEAAAKGQLVIDADRGSITIRGGDTSQVRVEVNRKVVRGSGAKAVQLLERHQVRFSQDGGIIRVEAGFPGKDTWNWKGPHLQVDIQVSVPHEFDIDAKTAGGSIDVASLKGRVAIRTAGGSLRLDGVEGELHGKTSGGSIKASRLNGRVELSTSGGSIDIEGVKGERLKATTSGGSIKLEDLAVPVEAKTSGGSIEVYTSTTPVEASTSGGAITATITSVPSADVTLKTSAGGITVALPENAAFNLDASTSAGSVRSEFPVPITRSEVRSSLTGPVNGGGPALRLRTSAGSIRVKKA